MEKEQNSPRKKFTISKFFKSKGFAFGVLVVLFLLSAFLLVGMDSYNVIRPDWPVWKGIQDFFAKFGIPPFDVTIWTWLFVAIFFLVAFYIVFSCFFTKKYVTFRNDRHYNKKGEEYTTQRKVLIGILLNIIILGLVVAAVLLFWYLMPAQWKDWFLSYKFSAATVGNMFMCVGIVFALILIPIVCIAVLILAIYLIIRIISAIIAAITNNVMASEGYQKAKAATDIANEELKKAAGKGMRSGDGGANNRESPYAEFLFPALMVIDHKWAALEEEKKAAEEETNKKAAEEAPTDVTPTDTTVGEGEVPSATIDDEELEEEIEQITSDKLTYDQFKLLAFEFQSFLCAQKYYFDINILRSFISGLGAARLILLEGLSGTGKSTLPRMFLEYVGGKAYFFPVQATWRDRSDITGYYSDFTGEFKETELLKHLYEASYTPELVNLMVLDEMNISRVEYYFADFLSIFEYPSSDWLVPLMQVKLGTTVPKYIEGGSVRIPENTWFVGTVNIDDSTFTITDKVYDRAIVIDFKELNIPFTSQYKSDPHPISMYELNDMFKAAKERPENHLSDAQRKKFLELCAYVADTFDLRFGNRIMNQIDNFLPIFVALGGTKEAALDIMFARKILRKLDGKFESYIKDGLVKLSRYINQSYGKHVFKETEALIEKLRKKLS